jgi:prepilin peptidase CpaA
MPQALHVLNQVCIVAFAALAVLAALGDWSRFMIPNKLSLAIVGLWILYALIRVLQGESPIFIVWSIGIAALIFLVGFGLFALRLLGGGDVKLLAAAALWAGLDYVLPFILIVTVTGALLGLAFLVPGIGNKFEDEPSSTDTAASASGNAGTGATQLPPGPTQPGPAPDGIVTTGRLGRKMPYGLAIAVGCVTITLYRLSLGG